MKIHMKDQRLRFNAGMDFPTCKAGAKLLDLDEARKPMTGNIHETTCKECQRVYYKGDRR